MKFAINAKKEEKKEKEAIPSAPELEENSNLTKKVQIAKGGKKQKSAIALYDYIARGKTDISFRKGDRLEIDNDNNSIWWNVVHSNTREMGWVPKNYLALDTEIWFFDKITRNEAEKLLLEKHNPSGAFLVRPSESNPDSFTLSVKQNLDGPPPGYLLKHFKINVDAGGFYISKTRIFPTLEALVSAHREKIPTVTGVILTKPCTRAQVSVAKRNSAIVDHNENHFYIIFYILFALLCLAVQHM